MALELASEADLHNILHHFSSRIDLQWFQGLLDTWKIDYTMQFSMRRVSVQAMTYGQVWIKIVRRSNWIPEVRCHRWIPQVSLHLADFRVEI